jgi:hypothetical protein
VIKHNFDQTPKLLETFDQLIRSSEIRSSDHFPSVYLHWRKTWIDCFSGNTTVSALELCSVSLKIIILIICFPLGNTTSKATLGQNTDQC